jgi:LytS/YehU family sensor histidine kinase
VEVLPFLVQPIIENSVKHGVSMLKENGLIVVRIFRSQSDLIYEIHDNGARFDVENVKMRKGLKLVEERISLFNLGSKSKNIEVNMKSSNQGTIVTLNYKNIL